jgi:glutathione synthase/RimK-type ligase-like ATP-grasp enzyme
MPTRRISNLNKQLMNSTLIGLATLARMAYQRESFTPLTEQLLNRLAENDSDANALLDFSMVLHLSDQTALAQAMQAEALGIQQVFTLPNTLGLPESETLHVLAFMIPGDLTRNTAIEFLVEGSPITLHLVYVHAQKPLPAAIPNHDIAFVAICESAANYPTLTHLAELTKNWSKPLINPALVIAEMGRDATSLVLQGLPKTVTPLTIRTDRPRLTTLAAGALYPGITWPMIIRPVDSHKGQGLARLEDRAGLTQYLHERTEHSFFVAPYIDYRSADGQHRKYRVVLMDGQAFICHVCIADQWMVHYMSAGMTDETPEGIQKREEEASCFARFDQPDGFASKHAEAFAALHQRIGLPYIGLDCGEMPNGDLAIFEVDCGMTVHAMDRPESFPYKAPQMRKVFDAFYRMLKSHAGQ